MVPSNVNLRIVWREFSTNGWGGERRSSCAGHSWRSRGAGASERAAWWSSFCIDRTLSLAKQRQLHEDHSWFSCGGSANLSTRLPRTKCSKRAVRFLIRCPCNSFSSLSVEKPCCMWFGTAEICRRRIWCNLRSSRMQSDGRAASVLENFCPKIFTGHTTFIFGSDRSVDSTRREKYSGKINSLTTPVL